MASSERPDRESHSDRNRGDRGSSGFRGRDPFDPSESIFERESIDPDDDERDPARPPLQREGRRFPQFEDWAQPREQRELSQQDGGDDDEPAGPRANEAQRSAVRKAPR